MVPLISTAEEAKKAVKFAKFPPRGVRGFGSPLYILPFLFASYNHHALENDKAKEGEEKEKTDMILQSNGYLWKYEHFGDRVFTAE
jgi:hypothetical protein